MTFSIETAGAITLVAVGGQLTINNRGEFKERVLARLADGDADFVIDFTEADYIDSSGLGVLVSLSKHIRDTGGAPDAGGAERGSSAALRLDQTGLAVRDRRFPGGGARRVLTGAAAPG